MNDDKNDPLANSNAEFSELRLRLGKLRQRPAPSALIRSLKRDFIGSSWRDRIFEMFVGPALWKPASVLAVLGLLAGVWMNNWKSTENEMLDIQPLLTAHARYQSESMVPPGDLANSGFGFQLASYYGEEN